MKTPKCLPIKIDTTSIATVCESVRIFRGGGAVEPILGCAGISCEQCVAGG